MTSFQSSELTELPVVENSQLFAQRAHSACTAHGTPPNALQMLHRVTGAVGVGAFARKKEGSVDKTEGNAKSQTSFLLALGVLARNTVGPELRRGGAKTSDVETDALDIDRHQKHAPRCPSPFITVAQHLRCSPTWHIHVTEARKQLPRRWITASTKQRTSSQSHRMNE